MEAPSDTPGAAPRRLVADVLLLGLLALLTWKVTYDISSVRDLTYGDEPAYMLAASAIPQHGLPSAEYCPLYSLWYRAVSLVQPDPVRLYYLSWQLLVALLVPAIYLLCRAAGGPPALAVLAAFLALNSGLLDVWPYPAHLAAILLAGGTAAAACCRRWAWSLAVLSVALLLASYARPEYAVSFLLFSGVGLVGSAWALFGRPGYWRSLVVPALFVLLVVGGAFRGLGNPLAGGRSFVAFAQHYAHHVVTTRGLDLDPNARFMDVCQEDFGAARTFGEAFRANPNAILWHCGMNLRTLPVVLRTLTEPVLALGPRTHRGLCWGLVLLLLLGLIGQASRLTGRGWSAAPAAGRRGLLTGLIALGAVLPTTLISCLAVYPHAHYLLPAAVLLFAMLAAGLAQLPRGRVVWARLDAAPALLLLGALLLALAPNRAHGWSLQLRRLPTRLSRLPLQSLVADVRALPLRGPATFLDYAGYTTALYAGLPPRHIPAEWKQGLGFRDFVRRWDIGVVILSPLFSLEASYRDDPEFKEFAAGGWTNRFTHMPVSGTCFQLAVRKDLLAPR